MTLHRMRVRAPTHVGSPGGTPAPARITDRKARPAGGRCAGRTAASTIGLGVAAMLLLSACAGAPGPNNVADVATAHTSGFWAGLWHGIISPITFIVSLFSDQVNIYDVHNNGGWYNFGFLLGVMIVFGGGAKGGSRGGRRKAT